MPAGMDLLHPRRLSCKHPLACSGQLSIAQDSHAPGPCSAARCGRGWLKDWKKSPRDCRPLQIRSAHRKRLAIQAQAHTKLTPSKQTLFRSDIEDLSAVLPLLCLKALRQSWAHSAYDR